MPTEMTAQDIKGIRSRYGLSQKAFARLLGLGDASIVRYENGQPPSKANANLIRAAAIPEFMAGCLEREGSQIPAAQREQVEKVVYAEVALGEEDEMGINEIYEFTLQREVLTERAWGLSARIGRLRNAAEEAGDEGLLVIYDDMLKQVALLKPEIIYCDDGDNEALAAIKAKLDCIKSLCVAQQKLAA